MGSNAKQLGLFDALEAPALAAAAAAAADAARAEMRRMIERLRGSDVPPWTDQMGVILDDGAFQRAMWAVPKEEGAALWAEFDPEMERMFAIWAAGEVARGG